LVAVAEGDYVTIPLESDSRADEMTPAERQTLLAGLEREMREAAKRFDFEKAAQYRDRMKAIKGQGLYGESIAQGSGSETIQ
jgi:excinuclease ABC subunit B